MTEHGKISVIMGIYNCAATLPAAIDSILAQTYTNWQLVMCEADGKVYFVNYTFFENGGVEQIFPGGWELRLAG